MSFSLTRRISQRSDDDTKHTWPLQIECTASTGGFPRKIFVYHRDLDGLDRFSCVASVQQLRELPEDAPGTIGGKQIPFFRKSLAHFECRTEDQQLEIWEDTLQQARDLWANWQASEVLGQAVTVVIE